MIPLTKSILAGITTDDEEAFLGAEEMVRAFMFGTSENVGLIEPYETALKAHPPQAEDIEAIKRALVEYLETGPKANAAGAVFALGNIQDPDLTPFLRQQLEHHLRAFLNQNHVVSNLVSALDKRGEQVISGNSGGVTEIDKTVRDARAYLQKFGTILPW